MKIFLSVVIVLLLGLCGWIRFTSTRPTEAHRIIISGLKTELEESRAEFDASRGALTAAKGEIENLRRRLASLEGESVARNFPGTSPVAPPVTSPGGAIAAPAPAPGFTTGAAGGPTLVNRLSELGATFETHRLVIENRKSVLDRELAMLYANRKSVQNTELYFSEQTTRVDLDGNFIGNRGVRTSSADRDRAKAKVADKVAEVDREIAANQTEINKAVSEMESLRDNYSKAIVRAREEFGVSGAPKRGN